VIRLSTRWTSLCFCAAYLAIQMASVADAHPMLENALEVVVGAREIIIDARISPEELLLVEAPGGKLVAPEERAKLIQRHAAYVAKHLRVEVDTHVIEAASAEFTGASAPAGPDLSPASLLNYRLRYVLSRPPAVVRIEQNFLTELPAWSASCVLRIRQSDQSNFDLAMLGQEKTAEFSCQWPAAPGVHASTTQSVGGSPVAVPQVRADAKMWDTVRAYAGRWTIAIFVLLFLFVLIAAGARRGIRLR
jgi:hypothetical protein